MTWWKLKGGGQINYPCGCYLKPDGELLPCKTHRPPQPVEERDR